FFLDADGRPVLVVRRIAVRHDRVQSVVAAEPLEHHQDLAGLRRGGYTARLAEEVRHRADAAKEAEADAASADADHVATRDAAVAQWILGAHSAPRKFSVHRMPHPSVVVAGVTMVSLRNGRATGTGSGALCSLVATSMERFHAKSLSV